jgi:hypothetical protein
VTRNGRVVRSTLTSLPTRVALTSGTLNLRLAVLERGDELPTRPDHVLRVDRSGQLALWVSGFKPDTTATVWGLSTPTFICQLWIPARKDASGTLTLPASMLPGTHTLVLTGTAADGDRVTMTVGIVINEASPAGATDTVTVELVASGSRCWWPLAILAAAVLLVAYLSVAWRRREA